MKDFCCKEFDNASLKCGIQNYWCLDELPHYYEYRIWLSGTEDNEMATIKFCPFCGKKITGKGYK